MSQEKSAPGAVRIEREKTEWHRRLAVALSAQLPDNAEDARAVLACVAELVETFLYRRPDNGERQDRVLRFARAAGGTSSCRTR